jgi:biotin-(acetyl-CoA carboxylase) ligase
MPIEERARLRTSSKPALDLPPPFRLVTLREVGDAFAHATAVAAEEGAGTLVYVGRFDLAEFAVVLEPEEPLKTARRALYAGLVALADALAVHAPPEKPLGFDWPDAVRVDGGLVGGARLGWPERADENEPPPWLVFGAMIRTVAMGDEESGVRPLSSALEDEGFDDLGSGALVESFARHLMVAIDAWQEKGFGEIAKNYLARLTPEQGVRRDIDDNGDLLVRRVAAGPGKTAPKTGPERRALLPALAAPSWLDPATGGPRR